MTTYNESQLDALRELANIASGTAATSLSQMLGREIGLSVPRALALPFADAVDAVGEPSETVTAVALPVDGDISGAVLLLIDEAGAAALCGLLGVEPDSEIGDSALCEIGNILGAGYLSAIGAITGHELLPCPPHSATDMLGAVVASMLAQAAGADDTALLLDSELDVAGEPCAISFLLIAEADAISHLLAPLGLASGGA
ncbi:chemotaxis protein CheC [Conexibacter sp. DBS9H8]|uniref:chemotaxis protein CheC n=1 Tax=Conexibacter sp. DBS9H8 TaxID=2937801 RepID=UPI00200EAF1A|nr:chemotaxis protein CheC [Conexibacter sp. DBS9H8]